MIELSLLGPQAVRRVDGRELSSLPAQPKRFALLAYLAIASGNGYQRRDTLAAMFWPDMDQFAARRALRNTLYHLREALGDDVIVTRGDDAVSVDSTHLTCDVNRLTDAINAGRFEEAIDLHRGELLAGIHFPNSGEAFEEWLGHERARVTDLVLKALRALVDREEKAGRTSQAAYWAQRACALAPSDEVWLRKAMSLLETGADRGSALRLYEATARRLDAEFGAKPSAETSALAARIRKGDGGRPSNDAPAPVGDEPPALVAIPAEPVVAARVTDSPRVTILPRRSWRRRAALWMVAGVVVAAGLAGGLRMIRVRHGAAAAVRPRVLVAVFDNRTGDPGLEVLGRMAQDWLTQGIMRTGLVDVVDSRAVVEQDDRADRDPLVLAQRTGASMVVSGTYYRSGDSLLFQSTLADARTNRVVRVVGPIVTTVEKPVAALNDLQSRVMTGLAATVDARVANAFTARLDVPSFDAYRAYVDGWDAFWHGDGTRAQQLFALAATRDTSFTAASIAQAMAAANYHRCETVDSVVRRMNLRARPIDRVDALTLRIAGARCAGRNEEMLRLTIERADLVPGNSWLGSAGAAALWADRPHQALEIFRRINPETDLTWSTDSTHVAYWCGLTESLHLIGQHEDELAAANRVSPAAPLTRAFLRARALAALGRSADVLAVLDTAMTLPIETTNDIGLAPFTDGRPQYTPTPAWVALWAARELAVHGAAPASVRAAAQHAVAWYRARPPEERATIEERLVNVWALDLAGAPDEAEAMVRALVATDSTNVDYRATLGSLAIERRELPLADSIDRWLAAQPVARVNWSASYYLAHNAALLGHFDDAVARTRDAFDEGAWAMYLHIDPALAPLQARKDFAALLAPKG
jgi:DNA-binding SARP family transcriptional activator/TolB-like protein